MKRNFYNIPYDALNNVYVYDTGGVPVLSHNLLFNHKTYYDLFAEYMNTMQQPMIFDERALKEYIFYYAAAPMFQVPSVVLRMFRLRIDFITPAEMLLTLLDYGIHPF